MTEVVKLDGEALAERLEQLADLLCVCVQDGASIGFLRPLDHSKAVSFWQSVLNASTLAHRFVFAAIQENNVVGTVQLHPVLIQNQPHRAEIAKMMVHPSARRKGIGRKLLAAAEGHAKVLGRNLLTLDTAGSEAIRLYQSMGYINCGGIPGFALDTDGRPEPNFFFYKVL